MRRPKKELFPLNDGVIIHGYELFNHNPMTERGPDTPGQTEERTDDAVTVYQHLELYETAEDGPESPDGRIEDYDGLAEAASFEVKPGGDVSGQRVEHNRDTDLQFRDYFGVLRPGEAVAVWTSLEGWLGQQRKRRIITNRDGTPTIRRDNRVTRLRLKAEGITLREHPTD